MEASDASEFEKLAELRDKGILTEDEFQTRESRASASDFHANPERGRSPCGPGEVEGSWQAGREAGPRQRSDEGREVKVTDVP